MSQETVTHCLDVLILTDKAMLVSNGADEVWLPLSQIDCAIEPVEGKPCTVDIPEWLAIEKGLE